MFSTITTTGVVSVPVFSVSPPEHPVIVGERSAPINNTLASFWSEVGGMVVFIWLASCCGVGGSHTVGGLVPVRAVPSRGGSGGGVLLLGSS